MRLQNIADRISYKIKSIRIKKYRENVPFHESTTFVMDNNQWLDPVITNTESFVKNINSKETIKAVRDIQKKLSPDKWVEFVDKFYEKGLSSLENNWHYADIMTTLYGIAKTIKIKSYLEIGVRRGRSMAIVASQEKDCYLLGFDMWLDNYAGIKDANPGPEFVKQELEKVGFNGKLDLISGDSRTTVPKYFEDNPKQYFDLITVDGDHSSKGATIDLNNVIPRLKIGGLLVLDDIDNPSHMALKKVWNKIIKKSDRFFSCEYSSPGLGVGFAIKKY